MHEVSLVLMPTMSCILYAWYSSEGVERQADRMKKPSRKIRRKYVFSTGSHKPASAEEATQGAKQRQLKQSRARSNLGSWILKEA
jgi:hypothetical protein